MQERILKEVAKGVGRFVWDGFNKRRINIKPVFIQRNTFAYLKKVSNGEED